MMMSLLFSCYLSSSLLFSCHLVLFIHFSQWLSSIFPLYSHHCSLIKVSDDHHRSFLRFSCCYGDRDKNRHCYANGLHDSQWVPCQFFTLTMFFIPRWTHLSLSLSLCLAVSVLSAHIFPSCLSILSLSLDLYGASMRQGCGKLALVQVVRSECRASMLELFANVHSTAHTPAWVTGFNYMGNCRENLSL